MPDLMPRLRFLRLPHACNYCLGVDGVTFTLPPKVRARLIWVACRCGRRHYVCFSCARRVGSVFNGRRMIAECARGFQKRLKKKGAV